MKDNRRILFGLLLVQVACVAGAFATRGIVSIACWVLFAALFILKYIVMFRRLKNGANSSEQSGKRPDERSSTEP